MFALLEHRLEPGEQPEAAGSHWDFLLEIPGQERLATWRLAENPLVQTEPIRAQRLADHRRMYLNYEGPLGSGRGTIRRIDRGDCVLRKFCGDELTVALAGQCLRGNYEIAAVASGNLVFRRTARDAGA